MNTWLSVVVSAQSRVVTGAVKDPSGTAIPGANITVKGTSSGTATDGDGKYSIEVSGNNAVLVFSFVGYATQEVSVDSRSVVDVTLKDDASQLQEVVVTALGIEKDRKSLSYSLQEVSGDKLTDSRDANMINALAGKVAGVQINRSASGIGGSTRVILRGPKSTNNNGVLYVIDGIPMANYSPEQPSDVWGQSSGSGTGGRDGGDGISNINPSDIESINVLKGASAAALYGSGAANGVILINTKKGKAGQTKIDFSSDLTADTPLLRPQLQFKYGQTVSPSTGSAGSTDSWGPVVNAPDHVKSFFRTGRTWINTVTLSGGTEKAQAYFSYSNTDNQGILPTSTFKRHTFNFRETMKFLNDRLTLDASVNFTTQKAHNRAVSGLYNNPLTGLYMFPRGLDFNNYKNNFEYFSPTRNMYMQNWWNINYDKGFVGDDFHQNPYFDLYRDLRDDKRDRLFGALALKYKLNDWLSVQARGRFDKSWDTYTLQSAAGTNSVWAAPNGRYTWEKFDNSQIYGDFMFLANKQLSNDLGLSATVGANMTDYVNTGLILDTNPNDTQGLLYANFFNVPNIAPSAEWATQNYLHKQVQSVLGNASLNYKERLFLDVSARNDWSSSFANTPSMKSGYLYYSAGLSGVISDLVKLPEAISFAKARVSYAKVGNDVPATYTNPRNYSINQTRNGVSTASQYPYPGTYLRPEDNRSFETGLELKFLENRIGLDFTFYQNDNFNQFVTFPAPASAGYSSYYKNLGHIRNRGVEIALNIVPVKTANTTWSSTFNFTRNHNTIVNLSDAQVSSTLGYALSDFGVNMYASRLVEGGSWGDLYANKTFQRTADGSVLVDASGNPQTTNLSSNFKKLGSILPTFQLGWYNSIDVKGFNISVLVEGRFGGKVLSLTQAVLDQYGVSKTTGDARDNNGANIKTEKSDNSAFTYSASTIPNYYKGIGGRAGVAEAYTYDATNIRLRELSVGYNLPVKIQGIRNIRVSVVGRNLFFFMNNAPFDPDLSLSTGNNLQGVDSFGLPSLRNFGGSVKIGF
ncbi:MAG: SusC/RagA family TonB-linked outer membrane protein [Bacteroidetes bacterium]|nr:SusC/RagA family TonB-linked outer membrane protein [Bacteroidota bacterium]